MVEEVELELLELVEVLEDEELEEVVEELEVLVLLLEVEELEVLLLLDDADVVLLLLDVAGAGSLAHFCVLTEQYEERQLASFEQATPLTSLAAQSFFSQLPDVH